MLSPKEVFDFGAYDTAQNLTRQLDFYKEKNINVNGSLTLVYKNSKSNGLWWLRSSYSTNTTFFYHIYKGYPSYHSPLDTNGVVPAFRIG